MKNNLLTIFMVLIINNSFSQEIIDLFIWAGQSNAQGWKGDANFYPSDSNNLDTSIRINYTFIGTSSSNGWITMQPQIGLYTPQGHFGAEVTFSRKLKQAGFNPAIFKYCKGATSLYGNWKAPGAGGYYDNMVTALNAAITNLENQGHTVNVRGFIWIQGEEDGNTYTNASAYEINHLNLINDMRNNVVNDSTLPIILGVDEQHPNMVAQPGVLNAHENIDENDDNLKFTSMYGLQKADVSHLTPAGLIIHGEQIFDTYTLLLSGQTPYSSCITSSIGNTVSSLAKVSWGQSFKPSCSGLLSEISFNSATNIASSLTISISNGADCNATQLYNQNINSITDGDNLVSISNQIYLDKEHTYYINITSELDEVWQVRYNQTNQVIGNLRTSLNGGADSTCGLNYPNFDLNFSVVITDNILTSIDNKISSLNSTYIYPNPNEGLVNIFLNNLENVSIEVFNVAGQIIYNKDNINSLIHSFELKNSSGMYFVFVNCKEKRYVYKLMIK